MTNTLFAADSRHEWDKNCKSLNEEYKKKFPDEKIKKTCFTESKFEMTDDHIYAILAQIFWADKQNVRENGLDILNKYNCKSKKTNTCSVIYKIIDREFLNQYQNILDENKSFGNKLINLRERYSILDQTALPEDVQKLLSDIEVCGHWGGEEPYNKERANEILKGATAVGCDTIKGNFLTKRALKLKKIHKKNKQAVEAIEKSYSSYFGELK